MSFYLQDFFVHWMLGLILPDPGCGMSGVPHIGDCHSPCALALFRGKTNTIPTTFKINLFILYMLFFSGLVHLYVHRVNPVPAVRLLLLASWVLVLWWTSTRNFWKKHIFPGRPLSDLCRHYISIFRFSLIWQKCALTSTFHICFPIFLLTILFACVALINCAWHGKVLAQVRHPILLSFHSYFMTSKGFWQTPKGVNNV